MKIGIIGGGALGLALAKILDKNKIKYELFERSLVGRKILASGNGKANIGNIYLFLSSYIKGNHSIVHIMNGNLFFP